MQFMSRFSSPSAAATASAPTSTTSRHHQSSAAAASPLLLKYLTIMLFTVILLAHSTTAFDPNQRFFDPLYLSSSDNLHNLAGSGAKRNWNNAAVGLWGKRSVLPALADISDVSDLKF